MEPRLESSTNIFLKEQKSMNDNSENAILSKEDEYIFNPESKPINLNIQQQQQQHPQQYMKATPKNKSQFDDILPPEVMNYLKRLADTWLSPPGKKFSGS